MTEELDLEIEAMGKISKALTPLDDDQRGRVVRWAAERFDVALAKSRPSRGGGPSDGDLDEDDDETDEAEHQQTKGWEHFADLYNAAGPKVNPDRLLVAAYWVQTIEGKQSFGTLELNRMLKDLGHGVDNSAHAMTALINQKPALILQLKKSGKSRQARKTYKVTEAGKQAVAQMINGDGA